MDVTGQAFEDMQEQNIRLMQQLREKDDANFKLMSERIKSNQIHKLLKEEKEELADQLLTLKTQVSHKDRTWATGTLHLCLDAPNQTISVKQLFHTDCKRLQVVLFAMIHLKNFWNCFYVLGGCTATGGEEAWGKRTPSAGYHQHCRKGARTPHTSFRHEQTQGKACVIDT